MDISLDILKKQGIEIVEIDINDIIEDILINTNANYFQVPALNEMLKGKIPEIREPLVRDFTDMQRLCKLPLFLLPFVKKIHKLIGEERMNKIVEAYEISCKVSTIHLSTIRYNYLEEII